MAHLVSLGEGKHQAESSGSKQPIKKFKPTKNNNNFDKNNSMNNGKNRAQNNNAPNNLVCNFCSLSTCRSNALVLRSGLRRVMILSHLLMNLS
jgi:hypothetical protein